MRHIFIIYVAAGLTLLFAGVGVATNVGSAYMTQRAIVSLKPTGDDLARMQSYQLVITPQSPLGEQLIGKKSGNQPQLNFGGAKQAAKILKVE